MPRRNDGRVQGNNSSSSDPLRGVGTRPVKREHDSQQNTTRNNPYTVINKSIQKRDNN